MLRRSPIQAIPAQVFVFALCAASACGTRDAETREDTTGTEMPAPMGTAPVSGLSASQEGTCGGVELSWTNPDSPGFARTVVFRSVGTPVAARPADGKQYSVGDSLGDTAEVIYVGDGAAASDEGALYHGVTLYYMAFAVGTDGLYATGTDASAEIDRGLGSQNVRLLVDIAAEEVAVIGPPAFTVNANLVVDEDGDAATVEIEATNRACRAVHNPKLVVESVDGPTVLVAGTFELDGKAALALGTHAVPDGATRNSQLRLSNLAGMGVVEIDARIVDHPSLIASGGFRPSAVVADSAGLGVGAPVFLQYLTFRRGGDATAAAGVVSPDGEFAYVGHGQQPTVVSVDLATLMPHASADLTGAENLAYDGTGSLGHVSSVTMSPDFRYLYAVLVTNEHRSYFASADCETKCDLGGRIPVANNAADVDLVRLERTTLREVDRVRLLEDSPMRPRPGVLQTTPDGSFGVLAVRRAGLVFLIDLQRMELVDGNHTEPGGQGFDTSATSTEPHFAAISPDGARVYVAYRGEDGGGPPADETLDVIDTVTGQFGKLEPGAPADTTENRSGFLSFGPDGLLYYGRKIGGGVSVLDVETNTQKAFIPIGPRSIAFDPVNGRFFVADDEGRVHKFRLSDLKPLSFEATGEPTFAAGGGRGHLLLLSPL